MYLVSIVSVASDFQQMHGGLKIKTQRRWFGRRNDVQPGVEMKGVIYWSSLILLVTLTWTCSSPFIIRKYCSSYACDNIWGGIGFKIGGLLWFPLPPNSSERPTRVLYTFSFTSLAAVSDFLKTRSLCIVALLLAGPSVRPCRSCLFCVGSCWFFIYIIIWSKWVGCLLKISDKQ